MDYLQRLTDEQLLALLIAGEADNQTLAGQVAVTCTVVERLRRQRPHYGLTLREVMLKPWQYSTFNDNHWQRFTQRIPVYETMARLAIANLLRSPVSGATHYHTHDLQPRPTWTQPQYSTQLGRVGDHVFYLEK